MSHVYAPGCALMLYKPHLAEKVLASLGEAEPGITEHLTLYGLSDSEVYVHAASRSGSSLKSAMTRCMTPAGTEQLARHSQTALMPAAFAPTMSTP